MPTANYGALGATFKITRALQVVSMVAIIGMTANFISQMVGADATPPSVLIGTLSVVSYGWMLLNTIDLIFQRSQLPFFIVPSRSFSSSITFKYSSSTQPLTASFSLP